MVGKSKWNVMNYKQRDQNRCDVCGNVASETLYKFRCYEREDPVSYLLEVFGAGLLGCISEESEFKMTIYDMIKQAATNYEGCIETAENHKQGDRSQTTNENKAKQSHNV